MENFNSIQNRVNQMGLMINAPEQYLQLHNRAIGDGTPYVMVDDQYNYITSERGVLISKEETLDLEELLYWIFEDVTSIMAGKYELNNRQQDADTRRLRFQEQIRLMDVLNNNWGEKTKNRLDKILANNPYEDAKPSDKTILDKLKNIFRS
jgi:hypothetical protein